MIRHVFHGTMAIAIMAAGAPLHAQDDLVRRLATVATIAIDEYSLGVVDGAVVKPDEYGEAQSFLRDAAGDVAGLHDARTRSLAAAYIDSLSDGLLRLEDPARLAALLERFRTNLQASSRVELDQYPDGAPSLRAGARLYQADCAACHGPTGAGDGAAAVGMSPRPADFTDAAALSATSPLDFVRVIGVGVAGTAMPGFATSHTVEERWALALYTTSLRHSGDGAAGRRLVEEDCGECLVLLSGIETTGSVIDDSLAAMLVRLTGRSNADPEFRDVMAFARLAAAAEQLGGDRHLLFARVIGRVKEGLSAAADAAIRGDAGGAHGAVVNAYLEFERVEPVIKASSPRTGADIEAGFARLRTVLIDGDAAAIRTELAVLSERLDRGAAVAIGGDRAFTFFGKSLLIIVREGMEAILIVGALAAFLVKAGAPERKAELGWGALAAIGASLGTAALFASVWRRALVSQELIEGVVMLIAAAVLFWVSYWLVSKIETRRWQAFVRDRVARAVTSGRRFALPAVAFLAVFREGFETVLFYAALYSSAEGSAPGYLGVTLGLVAGSAILGLVYFLIQRFGVRIPLRPFFAVTSVLLYVMAFSFAGQGIMELQASGKVAITPVSWLPTVPALGIFPTVQTLALQSLLAGAVVVAVMWIFWVSPRQARAIANS